jgi:hypothetical protein
MPRQDIADYLGLTIETVSRMLTHLEKGAAIALPTSRRVVLRNRSALNRINAESGMRGNAQDQTASVHAPARAAPRPIFLLQADTFQKWPADRSW